METLFSSSTGGSRWGGWGGIAYGVYLIHGYALNSVYGLLYSHPLYVNQ